MKYTTIQKLGLTVLATLICGTAFAGNENAIQAPPYRGPMAPGWAPEATDSTFFTNFANYTSSSGKKGKKCNKCKYDTNNGFLILATGNCFGSGGAQNVAYSFVAGHSGTTTGVTVAVTQDAGLCSPTQTQFQITLYDDLCAGPNTALGSATVTAPAMPCATVTGNIKVALKSGRTYWVACEALPTCSGSDDFTGVWWEAFSGVIYFSFSCPAQPYGVDYPGSPGAFSVQ